MAVAPSALALVISDRQSRKKWNGGGRRPPPSVKAVPALLFLANGVFQTADRVLYFALNLVGIAFTFCFCVAGGLARPFFGFALCLLGRAFDAILIDHFTLLNPAIRRTFRRWGCFLRSRRRTAMRVRHKFSIATLLIGNEVLFPTVLARAVPWGIGHSRHRRLNGPTARLALE